MPDIAGQIDREVGVARASANDDHDHATTASRTIVVPLSLRARVTPEAPPEQPARLRSGSARRR